MLLTKKQTESLKKPKKRINLYYGSVRSGKTYYSLIEWALFVASQPENAEFLMVGKTGTTLNRNCLRLLQEFEPTFTYSLGAKKGILYGRTIWFEGANDDRAENKIRGMTLQGAYVDELTLIPKSFYYMLLSRLSMKGAKLFSTTNPESPSNYVYTDIIMNEKISKNVVKFTIDDNDFLDREYLKEIKNEYQGVFYDRFILGNFVRAEGIIYRQFVDNEEDFLIEKSEVNPADIQLITIGIDYGAGNAKTTFKAVGITKRFQSVIVLDEEGFEGVYDPNTLYKEFHKFYDKIILDYGKTNFAFADWGGLGNIITMGLLKYCEENRLYIDVKNCEKGRIFDRIQLLVKLMAQGRFKIVRSCKVMREALLNAVWDEKKEDERLDDGSTDIDSIDALEYAIYPFAENLN